MGHKNGLWLSFWFPVDLTITVIFCDTHVAALKGHQDCLKGKAIYGHLFIDY